jgi:hypothetical protein
MVDSFTSDLLAALNAADDVASHSQPNPVQEPLVQGPDASGNRDVENRFALTVSFGMAKIRSADL